METNGVTWNRNLEGYILLMVLVLGLIPVFVFVFNFVSTPFIPQREYKYLDFFFLAKED